MQVIRGPSNLQFRKGYDMKYAIFGFGVLALAAIFSPSTLR